MKQNVLTKPKTHEGGDAVTLDAKTRLFIMGTGTFFGEKKFYDEQNEFVNTVHWVTKHDPLWVARWLTWLRQTANIRTNAIVGAIEYVRAGGPNGRNVVRSVLVRGDEPAEALAYYMKNYGRSIPKPIKRGIADAAERLYTERNFAKWDSKRAPYRMADVISLTHPKPYGPYQNDLFEYILTDRQGHGDVNNYPLFHLQKRAKCVTRKDYIKELKENNPTITWENVSSAESGPMNAQQWTAVIPTMGYMALLRNLRNFDDAQVVTGVKTNVGKRLSDPLEVVKSRQFPMRYWSAMKNVESPIWKRELGKAMELSLGNVPTINGKWLVLVDASASMDWGYSRKSTVSLYENACVFAAAFAKRNNAIVRTFSNTISPSSVNPDQSLTDMIKTLQEPEFAMMQGTYLSTALAQAVKENEFDHVLIITDEQAHDGSIVGVVSDDIPVYIFNVAGYEAGVGTAKNIHRIAGLTDAAFAIMDGVENGWPWENKGGAYVKVDNITRSDLEL